MDRVGGDLWVLRVQMEAALAASADTSAPAVFAMRLDRGGNSLGRQTPGPLRTRVLPGDGGRGEVSPG